MYGLYIWGGGAIALLFILAIGYFSSKYPQTISEHTIQTLNFIHRSVCNHNDGVNVNDYIKFFETATPDFELHYQGK